MNILKANRYRIVDNSAFEIPLPLKFTVWKADAPVCEYLVSEDEQVSYKIITKYKELMITTIHRPLDILDIYYLFSCRVFQDRTPYTYPILERMGLEKYNVLSILELTHGITPYDDYWLCFNGETINYEQAVADFDEYLIAPEAQPIPLVSYPSGAIPAPSEKMQTADVGAILNQNKVNVADIVAENNKPVSIVPDESYEPKRELENNKMSENEIEALLHSCGITDNSANSVETSSADSSSAEMFSINAEDNSQTESTPESDGKMSQEDIEKLLSSVADTEPAIAETKSEPDTASGGKMSQDDIEKLLAANAPAEPAVAETKSEPAPASGGKMSQDDIEKLLAANAPAEPAVAETKSESAPASGGKMSQDDIEKLLAANAPAEPAVVETKSEPAPASGGKMSQDDIEKLLAANAPAEPAVVETKSEPATASGGKMSQDDIEKLLAANAPAEPAVVETKSEPASGGKMSQADIEALLNSMQEETSK